MVEDLVTKVITVEDIPADVATELVTLFSMIVKRTPSIFPVRINVLTFTMNNTIYTNPFYLFLKLFIEQYMRSMKSPLHLPPLLFGPVNRIFDRLLSSNFRPSNTIFL